MCDHLAIVQVATFKLRVKIPAEEIYGNNAGEWVSKGRKTEKIKNSRRQKIQGEKNR